MNGSDYAKMGTYREDRPAIADDQIGLQQRGSFTPESAAFGARIIR